MQVIKHYLLLDENWVTIPSSIRLQGIARDAWRYPGHPLKNPNWITRERFLEILAQIPELSKWDSRLDMIAQEIISAWYNRPKIEDAVNRLLAAISSHNSWVGSST